MINTMKYILISMRPKQWVKNVFIFAGLIFSRNLFDAPLLVKVSTGFFLFSLAASSIYIFNDIRDIDKDRQHPSKSKRPLASGKLGINAANVSFFILAIIALSGSFFLDRAFFVILMAYVGMNIFYTLKVKDLVILDVMFIAFGFVLRVLAGTALASTRPSDWLIICTITISLFLGFSKRRNELEVIGDKPNSHRRVLEQYTTAFLDQMIGVATACTVMSYALYTISEETVARFGTRNLVFTIPFVLYGIYRYLYLIHLKGRGGNPTSVVTTDLPLMIAGVLWLITVIVIIY
jgi:4-hydroxybenzoate polyprenyltransferase